MRKQDMPPLKAVQLSEGRLLVPDREASAEPADWPGMHVTVPGTAEHARWSMCVYDPGETLPMLVRWSIDDVEWDWPWGTMTLLAEETSS